MIQEKRGSAAPFSWLLKPSLLKRPHPSLAQLLMHQQVEVLSDSLQIAYEELFEQPGLEKRKRKFRAEANRSPRKALDRINELATLGVLRFRQWQLLEHEPEGEQGKRSPDHLMLSLEKTRVLVEVKTLHLACKVEEYEPRVRALQYFIQQALAASGFNADIDIYLSYNQAPVSPEDFAAELPRLGSAIAENLKRGRLYTSYPLPNDGRVDVSLTGKMKDVLESLAPEKRLKIESLRRQIGTGSGTLGLSFRQGSDFRKIIGRRIVERILEVEDQITASALGYPGIAAVCMGHHDTSIREAIQGLRLELNRRHGIPALTAVKALLVVSLFDAEKNRLYAGPANDPVAAHAARFVNDQMRRFPVATVLACWVPLNPSFGVVPVGQVWDVLDLTGRRPDSLADKLDFVLPIFPQLMK